MTRIITLRASSCTLALTLLSAFIAPVPSRAHGGDPLPRQALPTGDGGWLLVTNFGVIRSQEPDRYICEEVFLGGDDFHILPLSSTRWIALSRAGVWRTDDAGCSFDQLGELSRSPAAAHAHIPSQRFAYVMADPEAPRLVWSEDGGDGVEEEPLDTLGAVQWTGLRFASASQLVLSGYSRDEADRGSGRLARFDLETRALTALDALKESKYPYLFDAHERDIAALASHEEAIKLLWGAPDAALLVAGHAVASWPSTMTLSPGGEALWVTGALAGGGVARGERDAQQRATYATLLDGYQAQCATQLDGSTLLTCARRMREGHELAAYDLGTQTLTPLVVFTDLKGPPARCAANSPVATTCPIVWRELARALRITLPDSVEPVEPVEEPPGPGVSLPVEEEPDATPLPVDGPALEVPGQDVEGGCAHVSRSGAGPAGGMLLVLLAASWFGVLRRRPGGEA